MEEEERPSKKNTLLSGPFQTPQNANILPFISAAALRGEMMSNENKIGEEANTERKMLSL